MSENVSPPADLSPADEAPARFGEVPDLQRNVARRRPLPHADRMPGIFVGVLTVVFAVLVVGSGAASIWCSDKEWLRVKEALPILLPAVTGLLGSVVGFYFGAKKDD